MLGGWATHQATPLVAMFVVARDFNLCIIRTRQHSRNICINVRDMYTALSRHHHRCRQSIHFSVFFYRASSQLLKQATSKKPMKAENEEAWHNTTWNVFETASRGDCSEDSEQQAAAVSRYSNTSTWSMDG